MTAEDDILISRYLAKDLDKTNMQAFEARLSNEPELAEELNVRKQEMTFLRTETTLPLLEERMEELASQHFEIAQSEEDEAGTQVVAERGRSMQETLKVRGATIRKLGWKRWATGAAVAAAVALVLIVWAPFAVSDSYEQFADYSPIYLTEKSSDIAPAAAPAETAFNAGNYQTAYTELTAYLAQRPDDNEARLALGIAALETDRDEEAQALFIKLSDGSSILKDDGLFYLALAYFKAEDPRAKSILLAVGENNQDYGVRVGKMLQLVE